MVDTDIRSLGIFVCSEHGEGALPRVVLRRLDCVITSTKDAVVSLVEEVGA
jgi:hypothetical protein